MQGKPLTHKPLASHSEVTVEAELHRKSDDVKVKLIST